MSDTKADPPSYEAALQNGSLDGPSQNQGQLLHSRMTTTRTQHIQHIIIARIVPLVQHHAAIGLSQTVIVLLPSDIMASTRSSEDQKKLEDIPTVVNIISSGDEHDLNQVQLSDSIDSVTFWSQAGVLEELRRTLKDQLGGIPGLVKEKHKSEVVQPQVQTSPQPQSKPRGFFSRRSSSKIPKTNSTSNTTKSALPQQSTSERVVVDAQLEEICLRTVSDFGLYETLTRTAVMIRVSITE